MRLLRNTLFLVLIATSLSACGADEGMAPDEQDAVGGKADNASSALCKQLLARQAALRAQLARLGPSPEPRQRLVDQLDAIHQQLVDAGCFAPSRPVARNDAAWTATPTEEGLSSAAQCNQRCEATYYRVIGGCYGDATCLCFAEQARGACHAGCAGRRYIRHSC